jgi:hypothetical protein
MTDNPITSLVPAAVDGGVPEDQVLIVELLPDPEFW